MTNCHSVTARLRFETSQMGSSGPLWRLHFCGVRDIRPSERPSFEVKLPPRRDREWSSERSCVTEGSRILQEELTLGSNAHADVPVAMFEWEAMKRSRSLELDFLADPTGNAHRARPKYDVSVNEVLAPY